MPSLTARTVRNVSYIGASQVVVLLLNLTTIAVLARILTPEDFGIVGIGLVFLTLFTSINDSGVAPAVIQRDTRVKESIAAGLALRWIIAAVLMVVVIGISPFVSDFYGNEAITLVLIVLSISLFIQPIAFASFVLLNRSLRFSRIAIAAIVQNSVLSVVSISLALLDFSYWSLVFGSICGSAAYVVALVYFERTIYLPKLDTQLMKEILVFGQHLMVTVLMAFVIYNVDQLVVGKVLGVVTLGIYVVAIRLGRLLGEQISTTVNRVLFPTLSRVKDSMAHVRSGYVQSLRMVSIVVIPLGFGISACSGIIVEVLLGSGWTAVAVPLSILAIHGIINAVLSPASSVLASIGEFKYISTRTTAQAVALVAAVYPTVIYFGLEGVCVLSASLSFIMLVHFMSLMSRILGADRREMLSSIAPPLASGMLTYVVLAVCANFLVPWELGYMVALGLLGFGVYALSLHVLSGGRDVRDVLSLIRASLGRQEAGGPTE